MRKLLVMLGLLLVLPLAAHAQGTTIFGGYSYVRLNTGAVGSITPTNINMHGWDASLTESMFKIIGATADFGQTYATISGVKTRQTTYMFGPELHFPARISPFVHALFGIAHVNGGSLSDNAFASAEGGGIDLHAGHFLGLRVIQADYLNTHFRSTRQNDLRLSAGILLRF
ncbi:MAG TPA: hypothetical protein VJN21_05455 [Candidatus Acidoferrales bacterium]|nr:hypothetical protein [Candidatus Acidoferrales bacterium]